MQALSSLTHEEVIELSHQSAITTISPEDEDAAKTLEDVPDCIRNDLAMTAEVKDMRSLCTIINLANMFHIDSLFINATNPNEFDELAKVVLPDILNQTRKHTKLAGIEAYKQRAAKIESLVQQGRQKFFFSNQDNDDDEEFSYPYNGLLVTYGREGSKAVGGKMSSIKKYTVQEVCIEFVLPHSLSYSSFILRQSRHMI